MINFTVGPVQLSRDILRVGGEQVPYFRTAEFSNIMLENEYLMKQFAKADDNAKVIFITGSGTASMEAVVMNVLSGKDKVLVVNGGSFGQRFVDLLNLYHIPYSEIRLSPGKKLTQRELNPYEGQGYTVFLVNIHETSTGVYYDHILISKFCQRNKLFLIVDAISSFLADKFSMKEFGVDVMITGSQKALACQPGISIIILSPIAIERVNNLQSKSMYLDLKIALKNGERGQTPFTPAVGILRQINRRLHEIKNNGGVSYEIEKVAFLAHDFRKKIKDLPFVIISESLSNALTPLHPLHASAYDIFLKLKNEYGIWVCPNGGNLKDMILRVGHIGSLTVNDNNILINALKDMERRGLI